MTPSHSCDVCRFGSGIDLYEDWQEFLDGWKRLAETDEYLNADVVVNSAFVNDDIAFAWYFLQVSCNLCGSRD